MEALKLVILITILLVIVFFIFRAFFSEKEQYFDSLVGLYCLDPQRSESIGVVMFQLGPNRYMVQFFRERITEDFDGGYGSPIFEDEESNIYQIYTLREMHDFHWKFSKDLIALIEESYE